MKSSIYLLITSVVLVSCSSWELKKQCEATSWFDYAQNLSKKGLYLEEDSFVQQCKEVDKLDATQMDLGFKLGREKLCSYDEIYHRGTLGEPVFFKFCDGLEMKKMFESHRQGLLLFCRKENGYPYGKSGELYKNVCNAQQENDFLENYFKGRKDFLNEAIVDKKNELLRIQEKMNHASLRELSISNEYSRIPAVLSCSVKSVYIESLKKDENKNICEEPSYIRLQRESIFSDLQSARANIRSVQEEQRLTEISLRHFQNELIKIPSR